MKYVSEYRSSTHVSLFYEAIKRITTRKWNIMEICGGQTNAITRYGIDQLLPDQIELIHGPGCPDCVTPVYTIHQALILASSSDIILTSFGDMLRVPGTNKDLQTIKAQGGNIKIVYSPLDALNIALNNPDKHVVFFGIGFENC